jgi:hypothetical protein
VLVVLIVKVVVREGLPLLSTSEVGENEAVAPDGSPVTLKFVTVRLPLPVEVKVTMYVTELAMPYVREPVWEPTVMLDKALASVNVVAVLFTPSVPTTT